METFFFLREQYGNDNDRHFPHVGLLQSNQTHRQPLGSVSAALRHGKVWKRQSIQNIYSLRKGEVDTDELHNKRTGYNVPEDMKSTSTPHHRTPTHSLSRERCTNASRLFTVSSLKKKKIHRPSTYFRFFCNDAFSMNYTKLTRWPMVSRVQGQSKKDLLRR